MSQHQYEPSWIQKQTARLSGSSLPSVAGVIIGSFSGSIGGLLKTAVLVAAWLLLASSSFTFGYDFIGAWLFRGALGDGVSRFLSAAACVLLFDLAYTSSLISFFRGAKSNAQRGLYGLFFVVPFALGLVASIAGFALLSEGVELDAAAAANIRTVGQIAIYAGIFNIALYGILPTAIDPENVARMLKATIESKRAEQEQLAQLIMEHEAASTYLETVRGEAHRIGQERGRLAADQFGQRWQLPAGDVVNGRMPSSANFTTPGPAAAGLGNGNRSG